MNRDTPFRLGDHFEAFVETQVDEGRYASADDVIRAGLQLLEEKEARLAALRDALVEGESSGPANPFDAEGFIARKRKASTQPG